MRQKVLRSLHFKRILIEGSRNLRQGDFRGPEFDLLFWQFSLGPPFAKSQKMGDFGLFAKSLITRLCRHLWRRGLRHKVLRYLHFKRILNRRSAEMRKVILGAPKSRYFFGNFPLVPLCKISENGRFWCLCKIPHNSALRALLEARFAPESSPILAL